jgi:hypothetical protein
LLDPALQTHGTDAEIRGYLGQRLRPALLGYHNSQRSQLPRVPTTDAANTVACHPIAKSLHSGIHRLLLSRSQNGASSGLTTRRGRARSYNLLDIPLKISKVHNGDVLETCFLDRGRNFFCNSVNFALEFLGIRTYAMELSEHGDQKKKRGYTTSANVHAFSSRDRNCPYTKRKSAGNASQLSGVSSLSG